MKKKISKTGRRSRVSGLGSSASAVSATRDRRPGTRKPIAVSSAISTVPRIWSPIASLSRSARELRNDV